MARLSVEVLGPPDIRHGQRRLLFPTRKTLAVLVYLLVEGGAHSRDKLTALFWPESDEVAGRASLRTTLARLREGLEEADAERHVIVDRSVVGFDFSSDFVLDLHALQSAYGLARSIVDVNEDRGEPRQHAIAQLQPGAGAWRGEFLEGFSLRDAPDFDEWASLQREVWRKRMEVVLDRLSLLQANAGSSAGAIETVERWLRLNPLEERAYRRLMRLHFAAGDRTAALRAYEACREMLEAELGVPPHPKTSALAERLRITPRSTRISAQPRSLPPVPSLLEQPLVGREDEFTKLVELYHAGSQGRIQAVVLQGEAGIGKTRLATDFWNWSVAQGAEALHGRAYERGSALPYQPLVDALRPRLEREPAPAALLSPVWLSELSRILPELRDCFPEVSLPTGDEAAARARLFEAVVRLGRAVSIRAPLVVFIDDVQWADTASLDVLHFAGRRWAQDETAALLLFCLRSEALATTPALDKWLAGLQRDLAVTRIDLGPLSFEDTLQLVQGLDPEAPADSKTEEFAHWIFAESGGQPFYLIETLRVLAERDALVSRLDKGGTSAAGVVRATAEDVLPGGLPPSVREIIHARLAPLSTIARDLLTAGAVLGQGFSFESLCQVGRLTEDEALPALDAVLQHHLLHEIDETWDRRRGGLYNFAHDKIRDVVYADAGEARRRIFHRRAMNLLEVSEAPAAELARHAIAAGLDEAALRFSIAAGDEAMRLLAARDAAAHYEQAITLAEHLSRDDLLAELHAQRGHAFVTMTMWPEARRELEAALSRLRAEQDERYAEILTDIAETCWWMLDIPAIERYTAEARELAGRLGRGDLETKAIAWLAAVEGAKGNLSSFVEQNERVIERAQAVGIAPPAITGHYQPITLYWLGRLDEAVDAAREAVSVAWERNDISWAMSSLPHVGLALAARGEYSAAIPVFEEARRLGREYGLDTLLARAIAMSAGFRLDVYDFAVAEALSLEARELAKSLSFSPPAISAGIDLLMNYARRHEVGRADALLNEVTLVAEETSGFHGWLWRLRLAEARAEIALARGDWEQALCWADDAIDQSRARGRVKYEVAGLISRSHALAGLGRTKLAIIDLRAAIKLARTIGDPALLLRAVAALLAVDGNDELAAEGRAIADRIARALPDVDARQRFEIAEPTVFSSFRLDKSVASLHRENA